jgi:hypothetical protein
MSATLRQLGFKVQFVYGNLDWALAEAKLLSGVNVIKLFTSVIYEC